MKEEHTWRTREDPFAEVWSEAKAFLEFNEGLEAKTLFEHFGRLCESDFTYIHELGVTIVGLPFDHLTFHFVLIYSNWETGTNCFGESLESLSGGFQNACTEPIG